MPDLSDLHEFIHSFPLVDTHEHLFSEEEYLRLKPDILSVLFSHYLQHDLVCSGASFEPDTEGCLAGASAGEAGSETRSADETLDARFRRVEEGWKRSAHTGFGEAARLTAERVYGITDISVASLRGAQAIHHRLLEPGKHLEILRAMANLDSVQVDGFSEVPPGATHPDFYRYDINLRAYCAGECPGELSFDRNERELEAVFARNLRAIAVKTQHAYDRPLEWMPRDRGEARRSYEARRAKGPEHAAAPEPVVGDRALGEVARLCAEYQLPLKIHTGYMAGTGFMETRGMGAGGLCQLFQAYPQTTFVLMHISYPFWREAIVLAKHYPNVYLDMCWAWSIDPHSSREFVRTFIHAVPSHKLFAFGGDTFWPVAVVGFAEQARRHLARALADEVSDGCLSEREAISLARRFMRENQYEVFDLAR